MANSPQKSKEATEAALEAIQEALGRRQDDPQPAASPVGAEPTPAASADLFRETPPAEDWTDAASPRRAANDDRANIGQILQTLHRRPSRKPYMIASGAAFVWTAVALIIAYLYGTELQALFASPRVGFATLISIASAIAVPVISFYVLAHMFSRAQDMRMVAESMAAVALRLTEPETSARDSIVSVGQAIRREVAAMGDGVERALARAAELEALVHNEVSALERAYNDNEVRIRDLLRDLTNQRETLVGQAEQVRNSIAAVHLDLSHDIASVGDLVSDKVNEVAQRVTRSLTDKGEHITLALGHAGDSMIDALSDRGSTLLERLESTSDKASTAITSASEQLTASLTYKTEHVQVEFDELAARLQQLMSVRLDQVAQGFAQKAATTIETMAGRSQQFSNALIDSSAHLADEIGARADQVNVALKASGEAVKDMLAARLQAYEDMFNKGGTELSEKIARESGTLGDLITRNIADFDRTVKTYGGELVDRLGQRTQDVAESMRNYVDTFDQRVNSRTSDINITLDTRLTQFENVLSDRLSGLAKSLTDGGKEVVGALDKRIEEVGGAITARGDEVANAIGAKAGQLDQTLGARALEVANTLDNRIGRFEELLVGRAEKVTGEIETRSKAAADALNARMEQLSQSIKTNASEAEKSLGTLALSTVEAIRGSAGEAERTLTGMSETVARTVTGKAEEMSAAVARRTNEMTTLLSDKQGGVLTAITEKGQQFASDISKATDQAMAAIEQKGLTFTRALLDNGGEIARQINTAGETAAGSVTRTFNELNDTAQKAIAQSQETSSATVREMLETHNMLRADTTALFERLREANIMLQEVLSGSHENMSALENTLMLRVSEFVNAMHEVSASTGEAGERVERNITGFRDVTARAITDLGQLAEQFDMHGRELAKAAEQIDTSNRRTEDVVNERRVDLDSLVSTLDIRTEDIEQRLKRFSGLLDESLEAASTRAREVARLVSESSAEGIRAISEQYERVRENAEDERRRSAEAMRSIYEQTAGDTQTLFHEANERFAEAVQGMKQMAAEMQRELDATRSELRRGVFELPQETAESAAQMRRVIVDQIEALAELNRIVARHGRNLDAVEPVRSRAEPTLAIVGGRSEPVTPPRNEFPPPRAPSRNEASSFAPSARRAEAPALSPSQQVAGRGWLSDLLNRASRDAEPGREFPRETAREPGRGPEERSPRHSIESLDSLSVDIARMIDHDAAADLWDRYKRGERNVFTRRLYTLQGQQAFDEIRKKYRADREFKQTVDRYIGEFERLLEEVSRDDRGQVVARTYLTSETGKVYTMLAHAAGRFD
jgi:Apolipoprotein A1/A4/E domain